MPDKQAPQTIAKLVKLVDTGAAAKGKKLPPLPKNLAENFYIVRDLAEKLGDKPLSACTPADLRAWVESNPNWPSWSMRDLALTVARRFFRFAADNGLIPANPFDPALEKAKAAAAAAFAPRPAATARLSTVKEVIDAYAAHAKRELDKRTYDERCDILNKFAKHMGEQPVADCIPADLQLWLDANEQWRSNWTRMRINSGIQRAFNWAAKLRLIPFNPFAGISLRPGKWGRPMEVSEFATLLRASPPRFRRVLIFLRYTGARPGELRVLQWRHVRAKQQVAVLPPDLHKTGRKTGRPRFIPLHPVVIKLLDWIGRHQQPASDYVFLNSEGKPWKRYTFGLQSKRLRKKCGLPLDCKLYGLRHAQAANAILSGIDIETVAKLMGHSNLRTTQGYCHLDGNAKHLAEAVARIDHRRFSGDDLVS